MFSQWCGGNATSKEQTRAEAGVTDSSRIGKHLLRVDFEDPVRQYFDWQKGNSSVRFGSGEKQMIKDGGCVDLT
jgi:hypothetical protein